MVTRLAIILISVVLLAGCLCSLDEEGVTTTTVEDVTTTTTTTTTTTVESIPVTSTPVVEVDECAGIIDSLNQSVCYFNLALRKNNRTLCEFMPHIPSRQNCLQSVGVEEQPTSRIFGNVRRKIPSQPLPGLQVSVYSTTRNATYTGRTHSDGTYSIEVHGGDNYAVVVSYQGKNFTQHVNARRSWEQQVDYIIAD